MLGVREEGTHKKKNREGGKQGAVHHWHGCHNIMFQNQ